jgi:hypothetical protein
MDHAKYHQLVLLWITDPKKFHDYLLRMAPIVVRYGGAGDRSFQPLSIWSETITLPHIVNFVHYDSKKSYEEFNNDPDFKKIEHLRGESTKLISYEGYLCLEKPNSLGIENREYNIEIAKYKNGSPDAYRQYEAEGEGVMKAYGFDVEFILDVEPKPSGQKPADFVKISYFKSALDKGNFEKEPVHKNIEAMYPFSVEDSTWISGKIYPMSLSGQK